MQFAFSYVRLASLFVSLGLLQAQAQPTALTAGQFVMLENEVQAGAYAEAFTQFCESGNRAEVARDQSALQAWAQRNHWPAIQARMNADRSLQQKFSDQKKLYSESFAAHRFKTAFACGLLPRELTAPAHDPSIQYGLELQSLESAPIAAAPPQPSSPPQTNVSPAITAPAQPMPSPQRSPSVPAPAGPQASSPAGFVVATTGEAANLPPASPITVGAVTFTPPSGWRVTESSPNRALLQAATQHTKAVLLVEALPLAGDFRSAFANALNTQLPLTGLKMQYPHQGVTGGGSPMIQILDNGLLRGGKQRESIDAVGVDVGNTMVLAVVMSGDWGGDNFGFQRAFQKMVTNWTLTGEKGPVWDPIRSAQPAGARAGLYFGSRLQNTLNPLGGMDLIAQREYLVLLASGQAFRGLPPGGHVLDMNFAAECLRLPSACGTYRIQGNQVDFTWRGEYGMVTHESSSIDSGGGRTSVENFNGTRAVAVEPVQHLRISGRYTSTFAQSGSSAFHSTSVVAQTFIAFSQDGTYQKSGFSSASFGGSGAGGTVQSRKGVETGRYDLNGYALTLTPADGAPPETFTTVFEEINTSPKAVFINDRAFLREGR